jgi:hypothetical protein
MNVGLQVTYSCAVNTYFNYRMNYCIMRKVTVVMIMVMVVVIVVLAAVAVVEMMTVLSRRSCNLEVTNFLLWVM